MTELIPRGFAERLIADGTRSAAEALAQQIGTGIELSGKAQGRQRVSHRDHAESLWRATRASWSRLRFAISRVHNRNEAKLLELARLDLLTGLPNRAVFAAAVQKAIAWARNDGPGFAVFYLDLDHFKDVNDTLGHPEGDALLKEVAKRLEANVRETDTVGPFRRRRVRHPRDRDQGAGGRRRPGGRSCWRSSASHSPSAEHRIRSGASIGIAVYGVDATGAEMLLSRADVALYRAKAEGRGTYRFFTEAMDADVRTRVALGHDLRDAIGSPQIFLVYQPQVDASTGRIVGVEALARWRHPMRGHDFSGRIHSGGRDEAA